MKHITLIIAFVISSFLVNAQGWMWAKHFNGTGQNVPSDVIQDQQGNYYVYGSFTGTVTQDTITLNSAGLYDVFIAKYNKNGQIIWLKQISGTATESAVSIVLSNDGNYIYISGTTNGTANFDGNNITSSGGLDVFLAKYALDGTLQWVHNTAYGTGNHGNGSFTLDASGNIIQLGVFKTSVTFYGGTTTLNDASGIRQNYIAKYDADGNLLWTKQIQDDNASTFAKTVTACSDGYFISGNYQGNLFLDIDTITSTGLNDGFLYKTDLNGNGLLVRKITGNNDDYIWKHKSDENGNQYLTGYFKSTRLKIDSTGVDTSLLSLNNVSSGTYDLFLTKYNSSGTLQWTRTVGSSNNDYSYNINEINGTIIITGSYGGAISFDSYSLTNDGASDAFAAVCNSSGQFTGAYKAAGTQNDAGKSCVYNSTGRNFVTTGEFYSTSLTIGSNQFTNSVQDFTTRDAYIARYGCFDSVSISSANVSCYGLSNGTATATPTLGSAPYTYLWSNDSTTATVTGLAAGTYIVTVTGTNNCTATSSVTISQPNALTSTSSQTNVNCYGQCTGTASVTPSGGTSPYTYSWSTIPEQTSATAIDLCASTFTVTVTDINNCTSTNSVTITEPAVLSSTTSQNSGCNGICNKRATVIPSGGTSPFTYLWNDAQTTATATGLCAGNYSVTVSDACSNTTTNSVTITEPAILTLTPSQVEPTINQCNGTATAMPSGGTSPYSYSWNTSPVQTTSTATGFCGGVTAVTVTDANGCTTSGSYTFKTAINLAVQGTPTANTATLTWNGSGATNYQIQYYIQGTTNYQIQNVTSSPYTIYALEPNSTYCCRIRTSLNGSYTNYSPIVYFTTANGSSILATNLAVQGTPTATTATLTWSGSGADSYQIQYYINGTTNYLFQNATNSPVTLSSLQSNTTYNCRIRTYSGGTYSNYSSIVTFTTSDGSYLATNLAVQGTPTANAAILTWSGSGADLYQIQYYINGTTNYYIQNATSSPLTLNALEPSTTYNCRIRTYSGGIYTSYSSIVTFTTANGSSVLATNLAVLGAPTATTCTLTWDGSGATSYQILYYKTGTTTYKILTCTASPATLRYLDPNTNYSCRIRTYSGGTYSSYSPVLTFTTASTKQANKQDFNVYEPFTETIIYPNPASSFYNLDFNAGSEGQVNLSIYNIDGRLCGSRIIEHSTGSNHYVFDSQNLAKGVYLIVLTKDTFTRHLKLIIQ